MPTPLQSFINRTPIPFTRTGSSSFLRFGQGAEVNRENQLSQMGKVSTLFSIADLIASKVAAADWHLYRRGNTPEAERTEVFDHPALVVWENPATVEGETIYTQDEFIEATQQHYELTGELDIVLEERSVGRLSAITDMWPVRPDRIRPIKSRDKFIAGYEYTLGDEKIPLEVSQVIVEKRANPLDPWRGLSPVAALMLDIEGEKAAAQFNLNFFHNDATPGGILELDRDTILSDREWQEWVERWRQQHQGVSNAHRIAVVEMGKFHERKISQRDMEFVGLRNFSRESMMEAYRVSKANLGHVDDVNRANNEAQEARLASEVIVPRLERWKKLLNKKLLPRFGALGEGVEFDYDDPTPVDASDKRLQERADVLNAIALIEQGASWNETLEEFELPPIPREFVPANGETGRGGESADEGQEVNVEPGSIDEDMGGGVA